MSVPVSESTASTVLSLIPLISVRSTPVRRYRRGRASNERPFLLCPFGLRGVGSGAASPPSPPSPPSRRSRCRRIAASHASIRSEEHTSELQSLMRISYAVFCLKKKKKNNQTIIRQSSTERIDKTQQNQY